MAIEVNDLPEPDELPELEFEIPELQLDTMSGDVRDAVLALFKTHRKTWADMTQAEQNMLVEGVGKFGRELVDQMVQAVTGWDYPRTVGRIADMKVIPGEKGRIEAKVHFQRIDENLTAIGRHVGDMVAVLMFDSDSLKGERGPAETMPDQPDLPMEAPDPSAVDQAGDAPAPDEAEPIAPEAPAQPLGLPAPTADLASEGDNTAPPEEPSLYDQAVRVVWDSGKVSTAAIQRKLAIGYNQAARLVEQMEAEGIVSRPDASGKREVLIGAPAEAPVPAEIAAESDDLARAAGELDPDGFEMSEADLRKQAARRKIEEARAAKGEAA